MSQSSTSPAREEKPSYLWAMLSSATNVNIGLGAIAASTLLSIPFGLAGATLPILFFAAGEAIASMFVPSSATFRNRVDRGWKQRRREQATRYLIQQISKRTNDRDPRWRIHSRLRERIESLAEMIPLRQSSVSERDQERLEDASVDYLSLWLAHLSMVERQASVDEDAIQKRVVDLDQRIEKGAVDSRSLRKARSDLEELLIRHRRIASRRVAVEAALLSMPDAVEEIYHAAVTLSSASEDGTRLQEAIDRLNLEQELEDSYDEELREILPQKAVTRLHAVKH